MSISTPYASTISGKKRRRTGDASIESPTEALHEALHKALRMEALHAALHEALHKALRTEALHDGSAYDGSTTDALYKSFVRSFVHSFMQSFVQSFCMRSL